MKGRANIDPKLGFSGMKITPELRKYFSEIGRKGGKKGGPARAAKLTAEQRREVSRNASKARWAKTEKA